MVSPLNLASLGKHTLKDLLLNFLKKIEGMDIDMRFIDLSKYIYMYMAFL